jgi:UDP-N-acetyl-D-mannosaminuronate dehydrogenase
MRLARLSRQINDGMGAYAVAKLQAQLGDLAGQRVLILGLAYRGDVKETAFSSTFKLAEALAAAGAEALVHDPLYTDEEIRHYGLTPAHLENLPPVAAVILQAAHQMYKNLDWSQIPGCRAVLDGRGVMASDAAGNLPLLWVGR